MNDDTVISYIVIWYLINAYVHFNMQTFLKQIILMIYIAVYCIYINDKCRNWYTIIHDIEMQINPY